MSWASFRTGALRRRTTPTALVSSKQEGLERGAHPLLSCGVTGIIRSSFRTMEDGSKINDNDTTRARRYEVNEHVLRRIVSPYLF